ncbi:MAG: hypothetical protein HKM04_08770 [Legionellales bacterium]|nr:hypothetical protein [Legionellales bacterium]
MNKNKDNQQNEEQLLNIITTLTRPYVIEFIKTGNSEKLITFIKSQQSNVEDSFYLECFKTMIRDLRAQGKRLLAIAIEKNNHPLVTVLLEDSFYDLEHDSELQKYFKKFLHEVIVNFPDQTKIVLITTIMRFAHLLKLKFLNELARHCFNSINSPENGHFYNAILDNLVSLPKTNYQLAKLAVDIHIKRCDAARLAVDINYCHAENEEEDPNLMTADFKMKLNSLFAILDNLNDNESQITIRKNSAIAKVIVDHLYSEPKFRNFEAYSDMFQKILDSCLNSLNKDTVQAYSELLATIINKNRDIMEKLLQGGNFQFNKKLPSEERNNLYYCDSIFAAAAIRKNETLYNTLLSFIPAHIKKSIQDHKFINLSESTVIRLFEHYNLNKTGKLKELSKYLIIHVDTDKFNFRFLSKNALRESVKEVICNLSDADYPAQKSEIKEIQTVLEWFLKKVYANNTIMRLLIDNGYFNCTTVENIFPYVEPKAIKSIEGIIAAAIANGEYNKLSLLLMTIHPLLRLSKQVDNPFLKLVWGDSEPATKVATLETILIYRHKIQISLELKQDTLKNLLTQEIDINLTKTLIDLFFIVNFDSDDVKLIDNFLTDMMSLLTKPQIKQQNKQQNIIISPNYNFQSKISRVFDYMVENGFLRNSKNLEFYEQKITNKIRNFINQGNLDELSAFIASKETKEKIYPSCFKHLINNFMLNKQTAMDLALSKQNITLFTQLLKCGFAENPLISEVNNPNYLLNKFIMSKKPNMETIALISALFQHAKCIRLYGIKNIIEFSIHKINYSKTSSDEDKKFYHAVLDCITAIPQTETQFQIVTSAAKLLKKLILCVHIFRSDVIGFMRYADDLLDSENPELLNLIMNELSINAQNLIEFLIAKHDHKMIEAVLFYHPLIVIDNKHNISPLFAFLDDILLNKNGINHSEKMEVAKTIIKSIYKHKNVALDNTLFSLAETIVTYCLQHPATEDAIFLSALVAIIFENRPDLKTKMMAPSLHWFQTKDFDKAMLYYCDSLFAAAALYENKIFYLSLRAFISDEEASSIPDHQFFRTSDAKKIRFYSCNPVNSSSILNNDTLYMMLYPCEENYLFKIRFKSTYLNPICEFEYLIHSSKEKPLDGLTSKLSRQEYEIHLMRVASEFHSQHPDAISVLVRHGYYIGTAVKTRFPSMANDEISVTDYFSQLDRMRNESKNLTMHFKELRKERKSLSKTIDIHQKKKTANPIEKILPTLQHNIDASLDTLTKASVSHHSTLDFALVIKDEKQDSKLMVNAHLRYELNSILDSLLVLIKQVVKFINLGSSIAPVVEILLNINAIINRFSQEQEFADIIDDSKKVKLINDGLNNLIAYPEGKHGNNRFNFLARAKQLFLEKTAPNIQMMEITLTDDFNEPDSGFINNNDL